MPPGRLTQEVFWATVRRPGGRCRTWRYYISGLSWEHFDIPPEELGVALEDGDLNALHPWKQKLMD